MAGKIQNIIRQNIWPIFFFGFIALVVLSIWQNSQNRIRDAALLVQQSELALNEINSEVERITSKSLILENNQSSYEQLSLDIQGVRDRVSQRQNQIRKIPLTQDTQELGQTVINTLQELIQSLDFERSRYTFEKDLVENRRQWSTVQQAVASRDKNGLDQAVQSAQKIAQVETELFALLIDQSDKQNRLNLVSEQKSRLEKIQAILLKPDLVENDFVEIEKIMENNWPNDKNVFRILSRSDLYSPKFYAEIEKWQKNLDFVKARYDLE